MLVSGVQLGDRRDAEVRLATAIRGKHVDAAESFQIFPPTRQFTEEEITATLRERGFDGLLYAQHVEAGAKVETGWLAGLATSLGSTTAQTPEPFTTFDVSLTDLGTGQVVWMASTRTQGSSYASDSDLLESFTSRTADELEDNRLLVPRAALR